MDLEAHKNQLCYDKSETHKPKITCMKFLTEDEESDIYKDITLENVLINTDHPWDYSKMKFESGEIWYKYKGTSLEEKFITLFTKYNLFKKIDEETILDIFKTNDSSIEWDWNKFYIFGIISMDFIIKHKLELNYKVFLKYSKDEKNFINTRYLESV